MIFLLRCHCFRCHVSFKEGRWYPPVNKHSNGKSPSWVGNTSSFMVDFPACYVSWSRRVRPVMSIQISIQWFDGLCDHLSWSHLARGVSGEIVDPIFVESSGSSRAVRVWKIHLFFEVCKQIWFNFTFRKIESKKSPTGPTERTPKPEYRISLGPCLGVRW